MDGEKLSKIKDFLSKNSSSIDTLSKSRINQLSAVDDVIQSYLTKINEAKKILKETTINVSNISTDTGISRKTFYNNDLLRMYVESYSTNESSKSITPDEYEKIKEKNDLLNKQVHNFVLRDIETEELRHENSMLYKEITNLKNRNEILEKQLLEQNSKTGNVTNIFNNKK